MKFVALLNNSNMFVSVSVFTILESIIEDATVNVWSIFVSEIVAFLLRFFRMLLLISWIFFKSKDGSFVLISDYESKLLMSIDD